MVRLRLLLIVPLIVYLSLQVLYGENLSRAFHVFFLSSLALMEISLFFFVQALYFLFLKRQRGRFYSNGKSYEFDTCDGLFFLRCLYAMGIIRVFLAVPVRNI